MGYHKPRVESGNGWIRTYVSGQVLEQHLHRYDTGPFSWVCTYVNGDGIQCDTVVSYSGKSFFPDYGQRVYPENATYTALPRQLLPTHEPNPYT